MSAIMDIPKNTLNLGQSYVFNLKVKKMTPGSLEANKEIRIDVIPETVSTITITDYDTIMPGIVNSNDAYRLKINQASGKVS